MLVDRFQLNFLENPSQYTISTGNNIVTDEDENGDVIESGTLDRDNQSFEHTLSFDVPFHSVELSEQGGGGFVVKYVDGVLKSISARGWDIKNAIQWKNFEAGLM